MRVARLRKPLRYGSLKATMQMFPRKQASARQWSLNIVSRWAGNTVPKLPIPAPLTEQSMTRPTARETLPKCLASALGLQHGMQGPAGLGPFNNA